MTVIYNPNTGIIAKIIFKIEIKKKISSLKATIVVLQSVLSAHLSFWFVLRWETETPSSLPEWVTKISPYWRTRWARNCDCNGARRGAMMWHCSFWSLGNEHGLDYSSWHIDRLKSLLTCAWRATNPDHRAAENISNTRSITWGVFGGINGFAENVSWAYTYQPDQQESIRTAQIESYSVIC